MGGNQKNIQTPNPEANPDPNPGGFALTQQLTRTLTPGLTLTLTPTLTLTLTPKKHTPQWYSI